MNETTVTVVGTVCSEVRYGQSADGNPIARFQIRNTTRRYDKRTGTWTDGDPNYFSAVCWRTLADHVASSMGVGDPVVAAGRLRISRWRRGEENVVTAELDIQAIGHDLRWGTTVYRQAARPGTSRIPGPTRRREEEAATAALAPTPTPAELEPATSGAAATDATAPTRLAIAPAETEVTSLPTAA
ncbi:single-strand DNA-binding protein [Catenulispora sp. EB89]|uniref:single-stranded DNA-binding protein n=1 Tax=Catenulispora sp. EB89 TaxID=3156257 RepID=UPI00351795BC